MMLAAGIGSKITVETDGEDETAAMQGVLDIIANRFGEAE